MRLPILHHFGIVQVLERHDLPRGCLTITLYAAQVHILLDFLGLKTVALLFLHVILKCHFYLRN